MPFIYFKSNLNFIIILTFWHQKDIEMRQRLKFIGCDILFCGFAVNCNLQYLETSYGVVVLGLRQGILRCQTSHRYSEWANVLRASAAKKKSSRFWWHSAKYFVFLVSAEKVLFCLKISSLFNCLSLFWWKVSGKVKKLKFYKAVVAGVCNWVWLWDEFKYQ